MLEHDCDDAESIGPSFGRISWEVSIRSIPNLSLYLMDPTGELPDDEEMSLLFKLRGLPTERTSLSKDLQIALNPTEYDEPIDNNDLRAQSMMLRWWE